MENLGPEVFEPAGWRLDGNVKTQHVIIDAGAPVYLPPPQYKGLRVFAGQADSVGASHFTIDYEFDGVVGTMDGWLLDDGSVRLKERRGPANMRQKLWPRPWID